MQFDATIHEYPLHRQVSLHFRKLELGVLEISQRLAKHLPLGGVVDGPLQRCFG
jgi:hypothetical protein